MLSEQRTIRILVEDFDDDQSNDTEGKGALPGLNLGNRVLDIRRDILQKRVSRALEDVFYVLSNVTLDAEDFKVDEVRFTLNINTSGEVSLVSLAKGSVSCQTGIEFSIVRRNEKDTAE